MSKGDIFENDFLKLILNAVPIANIADNAASSPLTNVYIALHTADPGEAGTQSTSEATYTGYARAAVARTAAGWSITGNSATPVANIDFPAATGGTNTITHASVGTAQTGAGKILWKGALSPTIAVSNGVTPRINAGTSVITED